MSFSIDVPLSSFQTADEFYVLLSGSPVESEKVASPQHSPPAQIHQPLGPDFSNALDICDIIVDVQDPDSWLDVSCFRLFGYEKKAPMKKIEPILATFANRQTIKPKDKNSRVETKKRQSDNVFLQEKDFHKTKRVRSERIKVSS